MKQIFFVLVLCFGSLVLHAQYKKSGSVFGGRGVSQTLNFGASTQIASKYYAKLPISFHFTSGADKEESRWLQTATIRIQLPADFAVKTKVYSYNTDKTQDVMLKAKTSVAAFLDYDWGIYFNDAGENVALRPFCVFGFGFHYGSFKEDSDNTQQLLNDTQSDIIYGAFDYDIKVGGNVKAGIGLVYMFSEKVGIKADVLYHYVPQFGNSDEDIKYYRAVNSGVVANLRLHLKFPPRG